jgi:hypothetical protein
VLRIVLPTVRFQNRFLIGLYLIARDCEGNISLRRQFRLIHRLRIQVKCGARLGMAKQSLNRFYVFASVDKKGRETVAEVVESESLTRLQPDSDLNGCRTNLGCGRTYVICPAYLQSRCSPS